MEDTMNLKNNFELAKLDSRETPQHIDKNLVVTLDYLTMAQKSWEDLKNLTNNSEQDKLACGWVAWQLQHIDNCQIATIDYLERLMSNEVNKVEEQVEQWMSNEEERLKSNREKDCAVSCESSMLKERIEGSMELYKKFVDDCTEVAGTNCGPFLAHLERGVVKSEGKFHGKLLQLLLNCEIKQENTNQGEGTSKEQPDQTTDPASTPENGPTINNTEATEETQANLEIGAFVYMQKTWPRATKEIMKFPSCHFKTEKGYCNFKTGNDTCCFKDGEDTCIFKAENGCCYFKDGNGTYNIKAEKGTCNFKAGKGTCYFKAGKGTCYFKAGEDTCCFKAGKGTCYFKAGEGTCYFKAGEDTCYFKAGKGTCNYKAKKGTCCFKAGEDTCCFKAGDDTCNFKAGKGTCNYKAKKGTCCFKAGEDTCCFKAGDDTCNFKAGKGTYNFTIPHGDGGLDCKNMRRDDYINSINGLVSELVDGLESVVSLRSSVRQVSQPPTVPLYRRIYKLYGQPKNSLPKRSWKAAFKRMQLLSDSSSDEEWFLFRSASVGFVGTLRRKCCSDGAGDESAAHVTMISCPFASGENAECAVNSVSITETADSRHCKTAKRGISIFRNWDFVIQKEDRKEFCSHCLIMDVDYNSIELVFDGASSLAHVLSGHQMQLTHITVKKTLIEKGKTRDEQRADESKRQPDLKAGYNVSCITGLPSSMLDRCYVLPNMIEKGKTHNDEERADGSEIQQDTNAVCKLFCITGFPSSILDRYRDFYRQSCKCEKGVPCMRHADIPGLSRSLKFNQPECSDLRVPKDNARKTDEYLVLSGGIKEGHFRSSKSQAGRFPGRFADRGSPAQAHLDKNQEFLKPVVDVPSAPISSVAITPNYGCDRALINSVTPLLHAQDFSKIIVALVSSVDSSEDKSLIPILFILGLSYFKLLNYNEAKTRFFRCDKICVANDMMGDSAICNLYLGDIEFSSHNFLDASIHYNKSTGSYSSDTVASLFRMVPPSLSIVHAKNGSSLRNASKMVAAIQEYKMAIQVAKTEKDKVAANTSLGNLYQSLGENTSALAHYEQSVEIAEMIHDYISLGWACGNMGNAYLGLFQKDKALFHLQKSLNLTIKHEPSPQAIGRTYNNLGTAYQSLGDLEKAQEYYDNALCQAVYGNDKPGQARVYGNMGNVLMLRKKYSEAVPHYTEVLSLSKDHSTLSTAYHNRGCAYYEWGENKMESLYNSGANAKVNTVKEEETVKCKSESKKPMKVGPIKVYIHGPDFKDDRDLQPRKVTNNIAKYYRYGSEDLSEVVKYHEGHLDNIKGSSKGLTLSVSLFETNSRTFHRYQDCLINLGDYTKALLVAEQSRARTLGELMLNRKSWYIHTPLTSPMPFDQVLATVCCRSQPILYLSYTGARLLGWVFVSINDDVKMNMFEVPLKDDQFDGKSFDYHLRFSLTEALVESSFEMYREVGSYNEFISAPVQNLYNLIAKPLLTILDKCGAGDADKLVVISDSYTALLPYTCLHDPKMDAFLGDSLCFQLMPSLLTMSVLDQLLDTNVVHLPMDPCNMCIVGNPNIPQFKYNNDVWNLGKLPHAKREAESVARILKTTPILEAQATKSAVLMRIINAKIIHLATHGSASAGFLAFGMVPVGKDKAVTSQGVLLYPEEVEKLDISPALVVLSSCDSGRGTVKADGIQGMARAFILAGSQAVLTTLWRVPDESAAVFMQFFYQFMMDGHQSTKALQKAILSIRCFSKYSQYIHWSGYQLTGRDVYFKYTTPEVTHILEKCLGQSSVFPRLQDVRMLETGLVNVSCFPTDVQILKASPGIDVHEVVIDFIHNSYKHFSSGIYWINCEQPECITDSIKYIEKHIGTSLDQIELSELRQCLFVFDGMSKLPSSERLLQLMGNRHAHCVVLYSQYKPLDPLIRAIDYKLLRGCKVHHLESLSMILSTQRIVYTIQKQIHFPPKSSDQSILKKLSDFMSGSPVLVDITSRLLLSYLKDTSRKSLQDAMQDFAEDVSLGITRDMRASFSSSASFNCPLLSTREISSHVRDSIPSVSTLAPDCRDVWDTTCSYDSWETISELLNACQFDLATKILLNCLSQFGCCPVPMNVAISLTSLITKMSDKPLLAGSLLNQLMKIGFAKIYPSPVILHSSIKPTGEAAEQEFVYVPKYIADCLWRALDNRDKAVAIVTNFLTLSRMTSQQSSFTLGMVSSLMQMCEVNFELVGVKCYQEVYRLYLTLLQQEAT